MNVLKTIVAPILNAGANTLEAPNVEFVFSPVEQGHEHQLQVGNSQLEKYLLRKQAELSPESGGAEPASACIVLSRDEMKLCGLDNIEPGYSIQAGSVMYTVATRACRIDAVQESSMYSGETDNTESEAAKSEGYLPPQRKQHKVDGYLTSPPTRAFDSSLPRQLFSSSPPSPGQQREDQIPPAPTHAFSGSLPRPLFPSPAPSPRLSPRQLREDPIPPAPPNPPTDSPDANMYNDDDVPGMLDLDDDEICPAMDKLEVYDEDVLRNIATSCSMKPLRSVSAQGMQWAALAMTIVMSIEINMTHEYVRNFKCKLPTDLVYTTANTENYMNEIMLAHKLVEVCLKAQWTRIATIKRMEMDLHARIKQQVEANILRANAQA